MSTFLALACTPRVRILGLPRHPTLSFYIRVYHITRTLHTGPGLLALRFRVASGAIALAKGLSKSKSVVSISLDDNPIGDAALEALCEFTIPKSRTLRHLSLKYCQITSSSMRALLQCYETGCTLYQVELQGNAVGCEAIDAFIVGDKSQVQYGDDLFFFLP